ncbi:HEAT repeat domain-containing protein [Calycomorphotria hydatis]|uniref:HEAT repeat domain-containing protein n=1 Tax=Calycomorphotria hydatis TaxID=2528027 RepID=UPI0011A57B44|nr:HEAT repeat domain-containing protein [Calycomorphotria hydatis]
MRRKFSVTISGLFIALLAILSTLHAEAGAMPTVSELIGQLESGSKQERIQAASALGSLGSFAAEAVPALSTAVSSDDLELSHEAALALGNIGAKASSALPELSEQLKSDSPILQYGAIVAMGKIGDASVAGELEQLLNSDNAFLRVAAAQALATMGVEGSKAKVIDVLVAAVDSDQPVIRGDAIEGLQKLGKSALPALRKSLSMHSPSGQIHAMEALALMGKDARPAANQIAKLATTGEERVRAVAVRALAAVGGPKQLPVIAKLASDSSPLVRQNVAIALGNFKQAGSKNWDAVESLLEDDNESVRLAAVSMVGNLGPAAGKAVPILAGYLKAKDPTIAVAAADALSGMGKRAVPQLKKALSDPDSSELALISLEKIGPDAAAALPQLLKLLDSENEQIRLGAFLCIANIGEVAQADAAAPLIAYLEDTSRKNRSAAAYTLGKIGAESAVPVLQKYVNDPAEERLPLATAYSLVMLKPDDSEYLDLALPRLISNLNAEEPFVRLEIIRLLGQLGPKAESASSALAERLSDPEPQNRADAAIALGKIGNVSESTLTRLVKELDDQVPFVRYATTYAIGLCGDSASSAVPVLEERLSSEDFFQKATAAWALLKIEPNHAQRDVAVDVMLEALRSSDNRLRIAAVKALAGLREEGRIDSAITAALESEADPQVKEKMQAALDQ